MAMNNKLYEMATSVPIEQEARQTLEPVWISKTEKSLVPTEIRTLARPGRSLVAVPTELSQLHHKSHKTISILFHLRLQVCTQETFLSSRKTVAILER